MEFKSIEWTEGRVTLPRHAGNAAVHVMSLLDGELCRTGADNDDGPSFPKERATAILVAFFSMEKINRAAEAWFDKLKNAPLHTLTVPTGYPKYPGDDIQLTVLGVGQRLGAMAALCRDLSAIKILYGGYCGHTDKSLPEVLRIEGVANVFACLGWHFVDLAVDDQYCFHDAHLVQACECLAIASLNRVGEEVEGEHSKKRRNAATLRWKRDPTQKAKSYIREEWERWWLKKEVTYKNDEEFGRKMHTTFSEYESERSIANLSRKWKKEIA